MAYAALRYEDVAEATSGQMTVSKLRRITSATGPRGADVVELWTIADVCGVPREWLEVGVWNDGGDRVSPPPSLLPKFGEGELSERVALLERYVEALLTLEQSRDSDLPLPPA